MTDLTVEDFDWDNFDLDSARAFIERLAAEWKQAHAEYDALIARYRPPAPGYVAVYTLVSKTDVLYVGCTSRLRRRLEEHRRMRPWADQIVDGAWYWYPTKAEGHAREAALIKALQPLYNTMHKGTP